MLLNFSVQSFETFLNFPARIQTDDFSQFLLAERHLIADFWFFDALRHFGDHSVEKQLKDQNQTSK